PLRGGQAPLRAGGARRRLPGVPDPAGVRTDRLRERATRETKKTGPSGAGLRLSAELWLLRRLAGKAPPLAGPDARAGAPRDERNRFLLDETQLLADHAALGVGVFDHHG